MREDESGDYEDVGHVLTEAKVKETESQEDDEMYQEVNSTEAVICIEKL